MTTIRVSLKDPERFKESLRRISAATDASAVVWREAAKVMDKARESLAVTSAAYRLHFGGQQESDAGG